MIRTQGGGGWDLAIDIFRLGQQIPGECREVAAGFGEFGQDSGAPCNKTVDDFRHGSVHFKKKKVRKNSPPPAWLVSVACMRISPCGIFHICGKVNSVRQVQVRREPEMTITHRETSGESASLEPDGHFTP